MEIDLIDSDAQFFSNTNNENIEVEITSPIFIDPENQRVNQ